MAHKFDVWEVAVCIDKIGLSLIDERPNEIMFIAIEGISLGITYDKNLSEFLRSNLLVLDIQADFQINQ